MDCDYHNAVKETLSGAAPDDVNGEDFDTRNQMPKLGDEVVVTLKARAADGSVLEERRRLEYEIGSQGLGPISSAADRLLPGMRPGEEETVDCGPAAHDGATLTLRLDEIYPQYEDLSFVKGDGAVLKRIIMRGCGRQTPCDGARATLSVEVASDGNEALAGFKPDVLEFTLGNGEVCDALELAAATMRKGDKVLLKVNRPELAREARLGLEQIATERAVFTLTLLDFELLPDPLQMSTAELLEFASSRKEAGTALFKTGRLRLAFQRYSSVADLLRDLGNIEDEADRCKATELHKVCQLNKGACLLKLNDHVGARQACDAALSLDPENLKALYRRAQAELGMANFAECARDCRRVIALDVNNKDARALLKEAQEAHKKSKGFFAATEGRPLEFGRGDESEVRTEDANSVPAQKAAPNWIEIADKLSKVQLPSDDR